MSRSSGQNYLGPSRFPRVSGDEPSVALVTTNLVQFSPRERG